VSRKGRRPVDALADSLARLTLVAGKGGVGKTTCAAALALRVAQTGARTLLLSTDPAGTLGDALDRSLTSDPTPVSARPARGFLDAFQIDAAAERQRFLDRWRETIVTIIDRGTYLDLEDITGLVDAALPGADEIFAVLRLGELDRATDYDRIIVDTAPTGHTLRLLDLPRSFAATIELLEAMQSKHRFMVHSLTHTYRADTADAFLDELRQQITALMQTLRSPDRTAALLVTSVEPLVVAESERYAAELSAGGIRIGAVVVNRLREGAATDALAGVAPEAPRYVVPQLANTPIGVAGLGRWSEAMAKDRPAVADRRRPRYTKPRKLTSSPAHKLLAPSLTIVGGKGGVGKTTAACALAIEAASLSPPVLLVSTDPAPSIADALAQPIGDTEVDVAGVPGLRARQMDARAAFREFQQSYRERIDALFEAFVRHGVDATYDRAILRDLLALSPPGIDELYALASLGETLDERRFARVIVDPAPTGHLLRLLEMPPLALDWSHRLMRLMLKYRDIAGLGELAEEVLAFARRTRRLDDLLRDPHQSSLVVVALDEPLVREETARLIAATRGERVYVGAIVWNRWTDDGSPSPLPVTPPVPQFVAPVAAPAPIAPLGLRAWARDWREVPEVDD
jgi:arsenite-transporting ATPase